MIRKTTILLVALFLLVQCGSQSSIDSSLEAGFRDPGIENRPLAFWDWLNGYVDTTQLVYELEEMKSKGMQGAFIWDVGSLLDPENIIPTGPTFLGEESLGYIALALKTGEKLGLNLGMITSSSWNAGGDWIDAADASKELLNSRQLLTGPSKKTISIHKPQGLKGDSTAYKLISTIALPLSNSKLKEYTPEKAICLDEFTSENKLINWEVPAGNWEVVSFFMCNTGQNLTCPSPNSNGFMIDHLDKQATKIHFDTIVSRLDKVSTATARLKFLEVDSYEVWPADDWTPSLVQEFKSRYEYDPIPYLPVLQGYQIKDSLVGVRFKADYQRLVSDLMIENHFEQGTKISNENGMLLFAEAGHGGYPRVDPLKAFGKTDVPMGEFWNRQRFWVTKEAASAAHIYGNKNVASETLTGWNHWQHGPTDYKQLCDIVFCEGLNQVFFHTFAHNPPIAGKPGFAYHAGEHINVNTTWWEMARPFMDYLSRCSYLLRQGNFVGDACLYYGDQAPNLVPPKRIDPNIKPIYGDSLCLHCGKPIPIDPGNLPGYDYDYINADVITSSLRTEGNKLVLPTGQSYRVMVLPDREDISLEVLKSIETLVKEGAVVIGRKPIRTTSLKNYPDCDTELQNLANKVWGDCDGQRILEHNYGKGKVYWGKSAKEVLEELNIPPDFEVQGVDNCDYHIDYIHRQTDAEDIFFISNSNQTVEEVSCIFRVDPNRVPQIWDAETGSIQHQVAYSIVDNRIRVDFILDPLASRFVIFRDQSSQVKQDTNSYDLQFGFHKAKTGTEIITRIDLSTDWKIHFDPVWGGPELHQAEKLTSWNSIDIEGIKYYSGKATYTKDFDIDPESLSDQAEAYVLFEDIQEMARVFINDQDCGILWVPPYKARITPHLKAGINHLRVEVINTWNNRIVGDLDQADQKPFTRTNAKNRFRAGGTLLNSGLIGKAELVLVYE